MHNLSVTKAALAVYPISSINAHKKKKRNNIGINVRTIPTPLNNPPAMKL